MKTSTPPASLPIDRIKTAFVTITPELASEWMLRNTRNRRLSEHHVAKLAEEMRRGRWCANGDAIRWAGDLLIDGQHRLQACIRSGVAFTTLVITGLDEAVFQTIDVGKTRSNADTLSVEGYKNSRTLAAALNVVRRIRLGTVMISRQGMCNSEVITVLEANPGIEEQVQWAVGAKKDIMMMTTTSWAAALRYLFRQNGGDAADRFFELMLSGIGLQATDVIYMLRQRLLRNRTSNQRLEDLVVGALIIKAWNAWRSNRSVTQLKFTTMGDATEEFPTIQ